MISASKKLAWQREASGVVQVRFQLGKEAVMGLSIAVGVLASNREDKEACAHLRRDFKEVNRLLKSSKLPLHKEPAKLPRLDYRKRSVIGQPYDNLHHLRRAVAYAMRGHTKLPDFGEDDPLADAMYDRVLGNSESHLICHSDCEGFYVPIDFVKPLYDNLKDSDPHCIVGGILGSSQGAMRELVHVAPLLGIRLRNGKLSDREFARLDALSHGESSLATAVHVWLSFYDAARLSIEHQTAIVFG
jgi:hypothetical protein